MTIAVHANGALIPTPSGDVHVEVEGDADVVVVLVSGGPGSSHTHYHPWFSRLAQHHRVVYYDHPGCGRSQRDVDSDVLTPAGYAAAIDGIRAWLDVDRISLVGLSFGGFPAIEYALTQPEHVQRLVLSNAQVSHEGWQHGNIDAVNTALRDLHPEAWSEIVRLRAEGVRSLDDRYQEVVGRAVADLEWVDRFDHPAIGAAATDEDRPSSAVYRAFVGDDPEWEVTGSLAGYDARPHLGQMSAPTLVVTGRYDRLTPTRLAHELLECFTEGVARLHVFERSAHRPWVEEPDAYFEVVGGFLAPG